MCAHEEEESALSIRHSYQGIGLLFVCVRAASCVFVYVHVCVYVYMYMYECVCVERACEFL